MKTANVIAVVVDNKYS